MNCNPKNNVFEIFTGQDKTVSMKCIFEDTDNPLDLTSCTEIVVSLPKNDGTQLLLRLSLSQVTIQSPAVLGNFSASINAANSNLLNVGVGQDINVAFTISGLITKVRFSGALNVLQG